MGDSLHRGPLGEPGMVLLYKELWKMNEVMLGKWNISVCGSSMSGIWREDSFTGDPEGYTN